MWPAILRTYTCTSHMLPILGPQALASLFSGLPRSFVLELLDGAPGLLSFSPATLKAKFAALVARSVWGAGAQGSLGIRRGNGRVVVLPGFAPGQGSWGKGVIWVCLVLPQGGGADADGLRCRHTHDPA